MNNITFIGRLTADPELKNVGETTVCNFSLARNRDYQKDKDNPVVDFIDCIAWGKTAEVITKYFSKGQRMGVIGQIQTQNYEDKEGVKRKRTDIRVDRVEFIEKKTDGNTAPNTNANATEPSEPTEEYPF